MDFFSLFTGKTLLIILFLNLLSKCETDQPVTGLGKVNLSVMEPLEADDNIKALFISIKKIELKGPGGWETYKSYDSPLQLNLLDNLASKNYFLGEKQLSAGKYQEARLVLDGINSKHPDAIATSGCYLQYYNGTVNPVYIPNNSKNGLLAKGEFSLPAKGAINITLNFDISEGITKGKEHGNYLLKPKINMVVNHDTGIIEGVLEDSSDFSKIVVFANLSNTYSKSEFLSTTFQAHRLAKSTSTSILNEEGKFVLSFLKSGKYDLYFYHFKDDGNFHSLIGKLDEIEIEGGQKTIVKVPREILID